MRGIAIVAVVALVLMFLGGWLYFSNTDSTSEVILDKEEVRQDTEQAVEQGEQVMEETAEQMQELGEGAERALSEEPSADDDEVPAAERP